MDDRIYRIFGSRLRELRDEKGVTQEQLAKRVDLSRTSITNIEKGRQRVMLHQLVELAEALESDVSDLMPLRKTDGDKPLRPDVAAVIDAMRRSRSDDQ